jgi:hypothetical protein
VVGTDPEGRPWSGEFARLEKSHVALKLIPIITPNSDLPEIASTGEKAKGKFVPKARDVSALVTVKNKFARCRRLPREDENLGGNLALRRGMYGDPGK